MLSVHIKHQLISKFTDRDSRVPCLFEFTDLKKPIPGRLDRVVFPTGPNKGNYPVDHVFYTVNDSVKVLKGVKEDNCIQLMADLNHIVSEFPIQKGSPPNEEKDPMFFVHNVDFCPDALVYITEEELEKTDHIDLSFNGLGISKFYKEWIKARIPKKNGMYRLPVPKLGQSAFEKPKFSSKVVFGYPFPHVENLYPETYQCHAFNTWKHEMTNNQDDSNNIQHRIFAVTNITRIIAIPYNDKGEVDLSVVEHIRLDYENYNDVNGMGLFSQAQHEVYGETGNYLSYVFHPIDLSTYDGVDLLQSPYRGSIDNGRVSGSLLVTASFLKKGRVHIYTEGFDTLTCNDLGMGRDHVA